MGKKRELAMQGIGEYLMRLSYHGTLQVDTGYNPDAGETAFRVEWTDEWTQIVTWAAGIDYTDLLAALAKVDHDASLVCNYS